MKKKLAYLVFLVCLASILVSLPLFRGYALAAPPEYINVAFMSAFTRPGVASCCCQGLYGTRDYLNYKNARGGINGVRVNLLVYDDHYSAETSLRNLSKIMSEKPKPLLVMTTHSKTSSLIAKKYVENQVPCISESCLKVGLYPPKWTFLTEPHRAWETVSFIDYYLKEIWPKKGLARNPNFAWLTWDNAFGKAGIPLTAMYLKNLGLKVVGEQFISPAALDLVAELKRLDKAGADCVLSIMNPGPYAVVMKAAAALRLKEKITFFNAGYGAGEALTRIGGKDAWGAYCALPYRLMSDVSSPNIALMNDLQKKSQGYNLHDICYEGGFVMGMVAWAALEKTVDREGWDATGADVYKTLTTEFKDFDATGGIAPPFDWTKHRYAHTECFIVYLTKEQKWIYSMPNYVSSPLKYGFADY